MVVVVAENRNTTAAVAHDVVLEGDLLDPAPWAFSVLVPNGEQTRDARLRREPVVLEDVRGNRHVAGILQDDAPVVRPSAICSAGNRKVVRLPKLLGW